MKYLKLFETTSDFDAFKNSDEWITPNISYIMENDIINYNSYIPPPTPPSTGDIAYWDGNSVKTISLSLWSTSLGTPIGVVVIPEGVLPDGKARIVSLKYVSADGTPTSSQEYLFWDNSSTQDTSVTNYNGVPITDNNSNISSSSNNSGILPSDNFTGATSFVDPLAKYDGTSNLIPSPYLGDNNTFNPEYSKVTSGHSNALSDFNGLTNTQILVGLGGRYEAATACWLYNGGVNGTGLQWYLPSIGEFGFLIPRFNVINNAITTVGGVAFPNNSFWSSSEYSYKYAFYLLTSSGGIRYGDKNETSLIRAFATI